MIKTLKQWWVMTLYYLGYIVYESVLLRTTWGFEMYNYFMNKSVELQDRWDLNEPWQKPE